VACSALEYSSADGVEGLRNSEQLIVTSMLHQTCP